MVFGSCPEVVSLLAIFGGIVIYLLIGCLIGAIISKFAENESKNDRDTLVIFGVVLWPLAIVAGIIYVIIRLFLNLFFGATRDYVDKAVDRVDNRISEECSAPVDVSDSLDIFDEGTAFKVGDIITGTVPQTDRDGNNISYEHLYQGCKCRVLSIKSNGSMRVILIDHKDKAAHIDYIGQTFTAPARNFTKVKKIAKKRKVVKKKSRR